MKKFTLSLIAVIMLLAFYPAKVNAEVNEKSKTETTVEANAAAEAEAMILRLHEIKDMDLSVLDTPEKNDLRNEVIMIKEKLQQLNGGIYISAGALLVIILLLILL